MTNSLVALRAQATVTTRPYFPTEAPLYFGVKRSSRARKFEIEFVFDAEASAERGEAWFWMKLRDGNHTVGLFHRDVAAGAWGEAADNGEAILAFGGSR